MLVRVTSRPAKSSKQWEVFTVSDYLDGEVSVHFEPLGALSPLLKGDEGLHKVAVAASAHWALEVVGLNEGLGRVHDIGVYGREVVERNAGFGEENEPLVSMVE